MVRRAILATNLQAGVRKSGMDYGLFERAPEAAHWLREQAPPPARVRVVGDDDSDGATSAHILATALRRAGYEVECALQPVHTDADLDRALAGEFDAWLIADAGSTFLPSIDRRRRPVLVVDHHAVTGHPAKHAFELNPRAVGGNQTWGVSASIVSFLLAIALDARKNWDLAAAAVAGAMSDRQHLGGFHGLASYVAEAGVQRKTLLKTEGLTLEASSVLEAITTSLDPYFRGLAGNPAAAKRFLQRRNVKPEADPLLLSSQTARTLATDLTSRLDKSGGSTERIYPLHGPRFHPMGNGPRTVAELSHMLEAATAEGGHALALSLLAGRPEAIHEARIVAHRRQARMIVEVARLEGTIQERPTHRWTETDDSANTGVYSHVLLSYVLGDEKPLLVFAPANEGVKVSARGSPRLFMAGLDLARAMARAAARVGGHGGGHPGAAGATLAADRRDAFLDALDDVLAGLAREAPA